MDTRETERVALARKVFGSLRYQDFRSWLPHNDKGSNHPLLIVMHDDSVGRVLELVEHRYGGNAHAVSECPESGDMELVSFAQSPAGTPFGASDSDCPVHPEAEYGMLVNLLRISTGPLRCRALVPGWEMELVDNGDAIDVPVSQ